MSTCHLLSDVNEQAQTERFDRLRRMIQVLEFCGHEVQLYGRGICNEERVLNLETQVGARNGWHTDFSDKLGNALKEKLSKGDLIVATEAWQALCFRGLLDIQGGKFMDTPVVEMWIDYQHSFAQHRIFSTRFVRDFTAGYANDGTYERWISAWPYYDLTSGPSEKFGPVECGKDSPFSLQHMELTRVGLPVVAPDWGSWGETVEHGISGILYRSAAGHAKAQAQAIQLDQRAVMDWVATTFTLTNAVKQVAGFLKRLSDG